VVGFPAQHVETFDPTGDAAKRGGDVWTNWPNGYPRGGLLFHGDNKEVLAHLLANGFRGKVNLIYIDPPFDSGADYVRKVSLRGPKGTAKLDGEAYTLGEQLQYTDIWANDNCLQFMYERLMLIKELLTEHGILIVHLDEGRSHYMKVILDEVFGAERFINEVISGLLTWAQKSMQHRAPRIQSRSRSRISSPPPSSSASTTRPGSSSRRSTTGGRWWTAC
jgi:DNA methylase